jgi:hypothetical protein
MGKNKDKKKKKGKKDKKGKKNQMENLEEMEQKDIGVLEKDDAGKEETSAEIDEVVETLTGNNVKLTHGETYYEFHGPEDGELVVCLHGITFWSFCFHKIIPYLTSASALSSSPTSPSTPSSSTARTGANTPRYRFLIFDFFGRGNSDAPRVVYNLDLYVQQQQNYWMH